MVFISFSLSKQISRLFTKCDRLTNKNEFLTNISHKALLSLGVTGNLLPLPTVT